MQSNGFAEIICQKSISPKEIDGKWMHKLNTYQRDMGLVQPNWVDLDGVFLNDRLYR